MDEPLSYYLQTRWPLRRALPTLLLPLLGPVFPALALPLFLLYLATQLLLLRSFWRGLEGGLLESLRLAPVTPEQVVDRLALWRAPFHVLLWALWGLAIPEAMGMALAGCLLQLGLHYLMVCRRPGSLSALVALLFLPALIAGPLVYVQLLIWLAVVRREALASLWAPTPVGPAARLSPGGTRTCPAACHPLLARHFWRQSRQPLGGLSPEFWIFWLAVPALILWRGATSPSRLQWQGAFLLAMLALVQGIRVALEGAHLLAREKRSGGLSALRQLPASPGSMLAGWLQCALQGRSLETLLGLGVSLSLIGLGSRPGLLAPNCTPSPPMLLAEGPGAWSWMLHQVAGLGLGLGGCALGGLWCGLRLPAGESAGPALLLALLALGLGWWGNPWGWALLAAGSAGLATDWCRHWRQGGQQC